MASRAIKQRDNELSQLRRAQLHVIILQLFLILSALHEPGSGQRVPTSSSSRSGSQINQRTLMANQQMALALLNSASGKSDTGEPMAAYKCAAHCTCSLVQALDSERGGPAGGLVVNLTRASCTSPLFSDILTLDQRTQVIHISLPGAFVEAAATGSEDPHAPPPPPGTTPTSNAPAAQTTTTTTAQDLAQASKALSASKRKQQLELMTKLLNMSRVPAEAAAAAGTPPKAPDHLQDSASLLKQQQQQFRMPRLVQFAQLREIVIVNLRIEVCDSEIFKRHQRLARLKWNHNQLAQVSKSCFRHLDKLLELNLDHNRLRELESALFSPLVRLRHLSLAHNRLSELTAHQFANLSQLQSLNLVGNSFRLINLNLFEPMAASLQLLVLAKNQIRQFVVAGPPALPVPSSSNATLQNSALPPPPPGVGVIFRNLIKLNVDHNKFERVKLLQLHRFFNVKFLSLRGNNIASIRDKAFNGLKLVELNLASNRLVAISRCAFCNATIKRLNLAENNISMPPLQQMAPPLLTLSGAAAPADTPTLPSAQQLVAAAGQDAPQQQQQPLVLNPPASSASMLVLSQSILGPLFAHLEYLDLSHNRHLASQLEFLLEPLLELQYLNLAATGLDRALPTPTLFKNLRHLRYLNLSMNHLDQVVAETLEPLVELELLDMSSNDFSELDESFLVIMDELPMLHFVNLASNPWYCSQCKISSLYEWISRSSIYNSTCLAQQQVAATTGATAEGTSGSEGSSPLDGDGHAVADPETGSDSAAAGQDPLSGGADDSASMGFIYRPRAPDELAALARGPHDYSLLAAHTSAENRDHPPAAPVDFDLILDLFDSDDSPGSFLDELTPPPPPSGSNSGGGVPPNYQLVAQLASTDPAQAGGSALVSAFRNRKRQLSERLLKSLASPEDDRSIGRTIASLLVGQQLANGQLDAEASDALLRSYFSGRQVDFCLKCEFPSELRSFNLHELAPADFKYCAGSAPRFAASEPKIGLTLAIVIIGALFVVIIVVIVMYRKKSNNAYYPGEDLAEQLEAGGGQGGGATSGGGMKKPVLSISSDVDHPYGGDNTDYSSPPMSQQSYTAGDEDESYTGESRTNSQEPEEDEDEDEDQYDEEEEEEEEDEEDEDFDEEEEEEQEEDYEEEPPPSDETGGGGGGGGGGSLAPSSSQHTPTDANRQQHQRQDSATNGGTGSRRDAPTHPKAHFESYERPREEQTQTETSRGAAARAAGNSRQASRELPGAVSRTASGGKSATPASPNPLQPPPPSSSTPSSGSSKQQQTSLNRSQGSQGPTTASATRPASRHNARAPQDAPARQLTKNDRDDSTPIYIGPRAAAAQDPLVPRSPGGGSFERAPSGATPASLSASDLLSGRGEAADSSASPASATSAALATDGAPSTLVGRGGGPQNRRPQRTAGSSKLVQLASIAGSLHESHSRAVTRGTQRSKEHSRVDSAAGSPHSSSGGGGTSSLSRSESRPPVASVPGPEVATLPKTILHHGHHQHSPSAMPTRQSSEQQGSVTTSTPVHHGPVSFAAEPHHAPHAARGAADHPRRGERLQRTSQTICVDELPAGGVSAGAGARHRAATSGKSSPRQPRHQLTSLATSSGHERSANFQQQQQQQQQPLRSSGNIFVSQASNGRTLVDFGGAGAVDTPTLHRARPAVVELVGATAGGGEFARGDTPPVSESGRPMVPAVQRHHGPAAGGHRGGRALVKQPHPQHQVAAAGFEPPGPQFHALRKQVVGARSSAEQQQQQRVINFEREEPSGDSLGSSPPDPNDGEPIRRLLAELPSDLDETDLDQMLASAGSNTGNGHSGGGGGALETFGDDDDDGEQSGGQQLMSPEPSGRLMRNSHSTHSALTQTGSRDFES